MNLQEAQRIYLIYKQRKERNFAQEILDTPTVDEPMKSKSQDKMLRFTGCLVSKSKIPGHLWAFCFLLPVLLQSLFKREGGGWQDVGNSQLVGKGVTE